MEQSNELPYTRISEDLNNKVAELMDDFFDFVRKAKSYGLDVKLHPYSKLSLVLYFNDDYPNTLLVDKYLSGQEETNDGHDSN